LVVDAVGEAADAGPGGQRVRAAAAEHVDAGGQQGRPLRDGRGSVAATVQ
jgi:hypothetical protein